MGRNSRLWSYVLLFFSGVVVVMTLLVTSRQARVLAEEERAKLDLLAEATRRMADLTIPSQDYTFIYEVIQRNETVPVVLTDEDLYPLSIRNVPSEYTETAGGVAQLVEELGREHEPIRIELPSGGVNFIFYGSSEVLRQLRYYPYVQLLLILVLVLLGYVVVHHARRAEQNFVWVGMAKETAHQLGTPISSLMGWLHLLDEEESQRELRESLALDVGRLQRVAERFSKIGAVPQLDDVDVVSTVRESVAYMQSRVPRRVVLELREPSLSLRVPHNAVLLQWVVENLIRNAVDAVGREGRIGVEVYFAPRWVYIDCRDSGCGIARGRWRAIFRPGYSTKSRGWGLGLSLARRIVREYHHGRIFVQWSSPSEGTLFRVMLRVRGSRSGKGKHI